MQIPTREEMLLALEKRHGKELQEKFHNSAVAICGLGGLGSNIAVMLARAGVGRLHLIDFDRVDISNLNRQQYKASQIGEFKTKALEQNLLEIAPYMDITIHTVRITTSNAKDLLREERIVCEAFDDAEAKAMLVNCVLADFPDKIIVAASGMAGLESANSIQTRKVMKGFYLCGDEISGISRDVGLISSRVTLCAAHQAHMILRLLAGKVEP